MQALRGGRQLQVVVVFKGQRAVQPRRVMIFNSLVFFLFYAIVLTGYFGLRQWQLRKSFLVLASFAFYGS